MPNIVMEKNQIYQAALRLYEQSSVIDSSKNACDGARFCTLPGVQVFYRVASHQKEPTVYQPGLVFIFSGVKKGEVGGRIFRYDLDNYLVLTSVYPFQSEVEATPTEPLLGIQIDLNRAMVVQMLYDIAQIEGETAPVSEHDAFGLECCPMSETLREQLLMLINTLQDPVAAQLFGHERVRSIVYTVLKSSNKNLLLNWAQKEGLFAQFQKAANYIHQNYQCAINIKVLSVASGMSHSSLNRAFKRYAADSPLQYIKKIRLNFAKNKIVQGQSIQAAAREVGYESVSQFSREFKRYFGHAPKHIKNT